MTPAIGLERLPSAVGELFDEAAANLAGLANDLDALVAHGAASTLTAIELRENEGDRITHDLISIARTSRRAGPDRGRIVELSQAIDDVVDATDDLAWTWSRRPIARLAELVLCVRDAIRTAAAMARAVERGTGFDEAIDRADEAARTARTVSRATCSWLLVDQADAELAVAGQAVVTKAEQCIRTCLALRERVERDALARSA